jgi:uncharacterized protein YjaG (DUF416 family)
MKPQKLQKLLASVRGWREQAFVLALAERAAPNAILYMESIGQAAQTKALPSLIDAIWLHILQPGTEDDADQQAAHLMDQLHGLTPDTGDVDQYGIYPARDVCALLEQALLAGINPDKRRGEDASQLSLATITQFIEFSEGEGRSESALIKLFDRHPLVAREFSFQEELYDLLRSAPHPSSGLFDSLRTLAQDEGVSNIGISLHD